MKLLTYLFGIIAIICFACGLIVTITTPFETTETNGNCIIAFYCFGVAYTIIFRAFIWAGK